MANRKIPKNFGVIIKRDSRRALAAAKKVVAFLNRQKVKVFVQEERSHQFSGVTAVQRKDLPKHIDMMIVLGGDGTLLSSARLVGGASVPILGVHLGQFGFIMETTENEIEDRLKEIIKGKYEVDTRVMLRADFIRKGKKIGSERFLNDAVINKGALARILEVKVYVDGEFVEALRGDGVIVATPTGSTAYSLSAGGPVIHPSTKTTVITPICTHMLSQRPLVVPQTSEVRLVLTEVGEDVFATMDGQIGWAMQLKDEIIVKKSSKTINLVRSPVRTYFEMLKDKLKLGHR